ncbi:MAG TPA: 50S ribosomal protein L25 [Patescibacteria group bacterium]
MQKHTLSVKKREIFGKKVKKLRREGTLPGNIYGHDFPSEAVQMAAKDFEEVFEKAGHSGIVELKLGDKTIPTLVHEVTRDHITRDFQHVDFYKVNLKEKVKAVIPLVITGEPKAVTDKLGLLMNSLSEVEVEALPTDLPEKIEVDVTNLSEVGESIKVSDLKVSADVTILTEPEHEISRIAELVSKEAEEQAAAEAEAAEGEATEGQAEETPKEEGAEETPKEEAKE